MPPPPTFTLSLIASMIFGIVVGANEVRDLLLERPHEHLLARVAVEVRVRVPEADEVERLLAVQLLVAGLQVDRGVALAPGRVVVEVAAVDVHPDAADLGDDLLEAAEVDRDQVVDRDARERLDRLERALGPHDA